MHDLVFNRTNASYLLGIVPDQIKKIEVWDNCVYVWGRNLSKFVSKRKFLQQFVDSRKERAKSLLIEKISDTEYAVFNTENDHNYLVELSGKTIACGCKDYNNQVARFGKGACKHIYATLSYLGYSSLRDYEKGVK